ncbi:NADP-dependent oxidoreductase [Sphingobium sp. CR2-8]|uniref:NADP-dependent oxidoreductase n=1 Tax=Sphingobium sp. CR2-8 TaxID=1306534 RepID=UPI002DBBB6A3|nr:NADP-dependent oxidoreductase [Sphingobium sp. CR2-8]MEC3910983.1 NADP-dependent oxidoreductase [Sphingobium sp. CR2-8]
MTGTHRTITLARRPTGLPQAGDFQLAQAPLPVVADGTMLVRNRVFAIDAAIRGFMDDRPSYLPPLAIGETIRGMALGEVVDSRLPGFAAGDIVRALAGWEEYSLLTADALGLEKCDCPDRGALSLYMGTLGPSGLTAYVGLFAIGRIKPGDTVAISAAAGAVGNVAGQIARLSGCRTIGITSSPDKAALCRDLGFDAVVDYNAPGTLDAKIASAAPQGIDVYFDNVGGEILDGILPHLTDHGRVIVCGMIANYNNADEQYPIRNLWQLLVKRATMQGFLTYEHPEFLAEAQSRIGAWVKAGDLRPLENVTHGLDATPDAFIRLMSGRTTGKTVVCLP